MNDEKDLVEISDTEVSVGRGDSTMNDEKDLVEISDTESHLHS